MTHFTALASRLALRQIGESVYAANLRRTLQFFMLLTWWEFLTLIQVHWDDPEKLVRVLVEHA